MTRMLVMPGVVRVSERLVVAVVVLVINGAH
jgi:hypothetical protein